MSRREQAETAMFDLKFFEMVRRLTMEWTEAPQLEVLNEHESWLARNKLTARNAKLSSAHDSLINAPTYEQDLHQYLHDNYPAYFGLSVHIGKAHRHNHAIVNESSY